MRWSGAVSLVASLVMVGGCAISTPGSIPESIPASLSATSVDPVVDGATVSSSGAAERLIEVIDLLVEAEEPPRRGYDRQLFEHWVDTNQTGCTARQDVLLAQAVGLVQRDRFRPCFIVEADWYLPFDGGQHSGQPGDIDIDHVVALAEAWDSGASEWGPALRRQFANDPLNLLVSDRRVNREKGDLDVGDWRPPERSSWCLTTTMIALTKLRYDLSVDRAEVGALRDMARTCDSADQVVMAPIPAPGTREFDDLVLAILAERNRTS